MDFKTQKEMINFSKKVFSSEVVNYIFVLHGGNLLYNYTQIYRKNKPVNIFYNKISKTTMVFEKTTEGVIIFPIYWTDEYAAGLIPESENSLNSALPDAILDEQNKTIKQHINEFDNPILIKYYFKK
ncbi:hypothetical protein SDC9_124338 [bioreactor metagenome]|uniref:Uncharacterized protein n=1 Tax=bioreactor metagenome TaxID=1076179 RepID=A0A645CK73_9ZZZZ